MTVNPVLDQERVAFLKARDNGKKELLPAWPRREKELPSVEVEVSWVMFSTLNHRTRAEQKRAMHISKKIDLFDADPLGQEAQGAQFKILTEQEGFSDLKDDLQDRGQQESAVITADGILINGNRRAAALRMLYQDEHVKNARYIKCLILPQDATPEELLDLEAELQVAKDFKEEYSWINEALLIEELYEREGRSYERVAARMHQKEDGVRQLHEKLQQVHQIVELSKGARLHIDFKENESAFDELTKHIRNKPKSEADSVRSTYFLGTLANVQYRRLRHLRRPDAAEMVMREIENDPALTPLLTLAVPDIEKTANDDLLDSVLGAEEEKNSLNDLLSFVASKKPDETVQFTSGQTTAVQDIFDSLQSAIHAAADEAEEEERDHTAVNAPLKRAEKAMEELFRASQGLPKARSFSEWKEAAFTKQLDEIKNLIDTMQIK